MRKKKFKSLQMNISNSYYKMRKHHVNLQSVVFSVNLFYSLIDSYLFSLFKCL